MMNELFPSFASDGLPILQVSSLEIGYPGISPVATGIQLALQAGQTLALVGGNGSGKTTFLKTVAGLLEPIAGSVLVAGKSPRSASGSMAWLGQFHPSNPLLPLRVRDLVRMAHFPRHGLLGRMSAEDDAITQGALEFVGMAGYAAKAIGLLSGGQRQKVYLAYVIARRAPLVLLDEPQQNLDDHGDSLVAEAMRLWRDSGATVVVATHDRHDAASFDQILGFPPGTV